VGRCPLRVIFATILFTLVCCLGLLKFETDLSYRIWYDSTTTSYKAWTEVIEKVWPQEHSSLSVILTVPSGSAGGILKPGCLEAVAEVRSAFVAKVPQAACDRADGVCESSLFRELQDAGALPLSDTTAFLSGKVQPSGSTSGRLPYLLSSLVGSAAVDAMGNVTTASALRLNFHDLVEDHAGTEAFEEWALERCQNWRPSRATCPGVGQLHCQASTSYKAEQEKAMASDQNLMACAVILMIMYMAVGLGRSTSCVRSKVLLGFSVIVSIGFSLAIAFGVGALFGVSFTQMSMLAIFILLGVGIDDAFIINDAYERTRGLIDLEARMAATLEEVGPSVLLTSATDLVAFLVGITYTIEAIRNFCISAAIAVFAVFICQVTWFAALLVLNTRREQANRLDLCPCLPPLRRQETKDGVVHDSALADAAVTPELPYPRAHRFLVSALRLRCAVPVLFGFAALLGTALYLMTNHMKKDSDTSAGAYLAKDSYLHGFWEAEEAHFGKLDLAGVFANPVALGDAEQLQAMQAGVDALAGSQGASLPRMETWLDAFLPWRAGAGASVDRASLLAEFVNSTEGRRYSEDLVPISGGASDAVVARAWVPFSIPSNLDDRLLQKQAMQKAYSAAVAGRLPDSFIWGQYFMQCERYERIDGVIVTSVLSSLGAIALVCVLMLPPVPSVVALVSICLVNLDLIGFISIWGVAMSVPTAAILVLAMGFSVDYTAHIAEGLCSRLRSSKGSLSPAVLADITAEVLCTTGVSVLHAGCSTLLAVILLAFSVTKGFQDLFKCFLLMVIFGLLHSLVMLPALFLSLVHVAQAVRGVAASKSDGH